MCHFHFRSESCQLRVQDFIVLAATYYATIPRPSFKLCVWLINPPQNILDILGLYNKTFGVVIEKESRSEMQLNT